MLPDFICVGAQRAATTWLHNCLQEHPDISLPEGKELHFFNAHYDKGLGWYESQFVSKRSIKVYGEATPDYLHSKESLIRIQQHLPDTKIIVILRQPFDRAVSAYKLFKAERFKNTKMLDAFHRHPYLIGQSLYAEPVSQLLQMFDRQQLLFLFYDDVCAAPAELIKKVHQFIGVDSKFIPSTIHSTYNKIIFPRTQEMLTKLHLTAVIDWVSTSFIGDIIRSGCANKQVVKSKKETYCEFSEYLPVIMNDVEQLEKILDIDLSIWKKELNEQLHYN
jgi:hypothetical protein